MRLSMFVVFLLAASVACAGTLAVDFAGSQAPFSSGSWLLGWEFNVVGTPYQGKALGFYDDFQNGLLGSHEVGIFHPNGALLVSTVVTPDDPLVSWWRWSEVSFQLPVGNGYRIAAVTGSDNYTWGATGWATDPGIEFVGAAYSLSGGLTYPDLGYSEYGYFGPNMMGAVPEPGTWAMMVAGLAALGVSRFRRSRR